MCSILLVEDHCDTRRAFVGLLQSWGHEVFARDSVSGGLAFLSGHEVEVILSDIGLQDGDGYEFISQVRQNNPRVIAIAVSAYFTAADQHRGREAGFDMYFSKPVDLTDLRFSLDRVSAHLGQNETGAREAQEFTTEAAAIELSHAV